MAPSQHPPVGDAAKLWDGAKAHFAKKDFEQPRQLASDTLAHCKAEGIAYGEAAASLVLGLTELGKSQGPDLLALFSELGLGWGEAAQLLHAAESRVASEGPAEASKKATAAAGAAGADAWTKAAELSVVALAKLEKDGPAAGRDAVKTALKLCSEVGLAWGQAGSLGSAASIRSTSLELSADLQAIVDAPSKLGPGKEQGCAQLKAAGAWLQRQDPEVALQSARQGLAQFRELGARSLEATALRMAARAQIAEGSVLEALQAANQAAAIFKELGHRRGEASSLLMVASAQFARCSAEDAIWKASEALKIFRQLGCRMEEGDALEVIARCALLEADFGKGLEAATQALDVASDLGDGSKEIARLCLVSQMHTGRGKAEEALSSVRDAVNKFPSLGSAASEIEALDAIVAAFKASGRPVEALTVLRRAQEAFHEKGREKEDALTLCRIAEIHLLDNEPQQGLTSVQEAMAIFRKLKDSLAIAKAFQISAELCASQGDNQLACKRAEEAIQAYKELGKKGLPGHLACLATIVSSCCSDGRLEEAFDEAKAALKHFNSLRERKYEASVMMMIADIEVTNGNMDTALTTLQQVPALFLAVGDMRGEASAWLKIARMHTDKSEPDLALHAAEEAVTAYRKLGDRAGKKAACQLVAETNFSLVPSGLGSARDAVNAAQEVLTMAQSAGDKPEEASAMTLLANAQLMSRKFVDAQKTAYQAEELYTELGDIHGQGFALMLTAGANLGEGKFAEAKTATKEATTLFQQCGDTFMEDNCEEFQDQIDEYAKGLLSRTDWMGFCVAGPDDSQTRRRPRARARASKANLKTVNIEGCTYGSKGLETTVIFTDYESRGPRERPQAKGRKPETSVRGVTDSIAQAGPPKREQVLYCVRWVKASAQPTASREGSPARDLADKCVNRSMLLRAPGPNVGRVEPSERMFHAAVGGSRGV